MYYDNTNACQLKQKPDTLLSAKHIELRHHFIRNNFQNIDIVIDFVKTNDQFDADIYTDL